MKNPENTTWNVEFFRGMPLKDFTSYWKKHLFMGDPKKYYTKVTGKKLSSRKKKLDESVES